ncbi:hypothetical protein GCK72_009636 [Caenorhabditis remanei]|uniref:Uncharacterized protein n=2 Tax=Caenorhabditis remanei TaxID=31234 RepID=E3LRU9_CAERE|nr:hypothetical protein GCK72_009636 [Caenorhabditis remanei]EFP09604.1 hypothetical protein CRE_25487 [Caenorhabditis remanei]KAF1761380.1 hypothetical protein GCK72_009636 [Caenorhabditis remanei]
MRIAIILVVIFFSFALSCQNFDKYMNMFCKYGQEATPCTVENYAALKASCCAMKGNCAYNDFPKDRVCCFTDDCLKRCFPGKLYKNGQVY